MLLKMTGCGRGEAHARPQGMRELLRATGTWRDWEVGQSKDAQVRHSLQQPQPLFQQIEVQKFLGPYCFAGEPAWRHRSPDACTEGGAGVGAPPRLEPWWCSTSVCGGEEKIAA